MGGSFFKELKDKQHINNHSWTDYALITFIIETHYPKTIIKYLI